MTQPRHIRIFLSSPGDVADERALALQVIEQLSHRPAFRDRITLRPIAWDKLGAGTPMLATMTPQEAINQGLPKPSECDIVVVLFWARMGTPLPEEYKKPDGSRYWSGTEWEYWDAFNIAKAGGEPLLVVYRRTEKVLLDDEAPDYEQRLEQKRRVKTFFDNFVNPDGSIRGGYNAYEKPEDFRQQFESHLESLILHLLETPTVQPVAPEPAKAAEFWTGSPFPGLRAFTPADAPIFFGRGRETDALVRRVEGSRFVAVVGASGSGKSSLIGAGLIPRLKSNAIEGSKDWLLPEYEPGRGWSGLRFTPGELGDNPFLALATKLAPLVGDTPSELAAKLEQNPTEITAVIEKTLSDKPEWAEALLFIDQFEELFTVVAAQHRQSFVEMLVAAAQSEWLRTVVTMRADFYHRAVEYPQLAELLQSGSFPLAIPKRDALRQMIERPAERAGLNFDYALIDRILDDTGDEPGNLALMAYALDEMYKLAEKCHDRRLTFADYELLQGVQGAIGMRAQQVYEGLDAEAQAALGHVFQVMVEINEQGAATRRRADLEQLTSEAAQAKLIEAFTAARLLTTSRMDTKAIVEVAHEALFRSWTTLAEWIQRAQDDLRLLRQFERDARDWERRGRPAEGRPRNEQLKPLLDAAKHLQQKITNTLLIEYADLDIAQLLQELEAIDTPHKRRSFIGARLSLLGDPRPGVGVKAVQIGNRAVAVPDIDWCYVEAQKDEHGRWPRIKVGQQNHEIRPFWIARYPVTVEQFQAFIGDKSGYNNPDWWQDVPERYQRIEPKIGYHLSNEPVARITWYQAMAFSQWLNACYRGEVLSHPSMVDANMVIGDNVEIRLPTEWEWQWAAQGGDAGKEYPWGLWDERHANTFEAQLGHSTAVGMYPKGAADCGALDMAGNVFEFCLNNYNRQGKKALRGGSYFDSPDFSRCDTRQSRAPYSLYFHYGMRVACGHPLLKVIPNREEETV